MVVLHGPGGTGKTELAKAFGRWSRDTGAVDKPDWVITHSFEPGPAASGLSSVVDTVGLRVFGTRFAALGLERRLAAVEEVLSTRRLLLIWDNFEAAHTVPNPAAASMTEPERAALAAFLDRFARNSRSAIVITSRTPEAWLGEVRRVEVTGLERGEAVQYAEHLLAPYPNAQPRREQRAFGELMQWLEGHPLSMRLVLPSLDTTDPARLLHRLKRGEALLLGPGDGMRNGSLAASIAHSFTHLSQAEQRALTLVGLVHGVADPNLLALVSKDSAAPQPFRGHTTEDWERLLRRAADLGLITEQDEDTYRIHSSLSAYLSAWWRADDPDGHRAAHAAATEALLRVYAQFGALLTRELSGRSASGAVAMIEIHRRTLTSLLGFACDQSEWQSAALIVQPLYAYWKIRGRSAEAQAWTDRLRLALEGPDGTPPGLDTPAGGLWTLAALDEAARQTATHRLAEAERTYRTILAALGRLTPDRGVRQAQARIHHNLGALAERQGLLKDATELYERSQNVLGEAGDAHGEANAFHHLGIVAHDQERLAEAERWYLKALGIRERLGDQPGTAASHHHLGMVAQEQGRLAEATERYRKSLAILEALGDRPGTARSYSQLGMLAAQQGRPAAAEKWYRKSLTVREQLGSRHETAVDYHHLGILAQNQGRLAEAEDWCRRALRVSEETGNRPAVASSRHQLGKIAHLGGRHTEAEQWYRLSLEISEELDSRPAMVLSYGELGLLSEERGRYREAMEWTVRCLACFEEFPHPATGPGPQHLARLTSKLGLAVLEEVWPSVTGDALPAAIRDFVASE
ncbi:tetratricopeptide repeat protein [Streptomyces kebangsaanensis]|uniref:tetratricopeptide repeat protein n=1 Tax=Streptomyces kebangsaanensis TaxID=864058 RepID=UPI00093A0F58|nr:tetratricopeptide repeat protein [Streptomyces kebangsaanensis]